MGKASTITALTLILMLIMSGCTGIELGASQQASTTVQIEEIYLNNEDSRQHTVDIVVQKNGTVAYWSSFRLNGTYETNGTTISSGETIPQDAFGVSPGQYVVLVRVNNQATGQRFNVNKSVKHCKSVSVQVQINGGNVSLLLQNACE